ncbi:MAG: spore maturation protein [Lachnospiraceae bacterium]|nr:spore maturation protein [Lachnospiraceae bacterium]
MLLPASIAAILLYGLRRGRPLYDDFIQGARDGMRTVAEILPTIVGLMVAVGVLRASGFLDFLSELLAAPAEALHFPAELIPLALVRIFSTSAANGLLTDIYATCGPDSPEGILASLLIRCTESAFYTMTGYCTAALIPKTLCTLAGALFATAAGLAASTLLAGWVTV